MEKFKVSRSQVVYKVAEMTRKVALTKDWILEIPVAEPCILETLEIPITLTKDAKRPAAVTVTVKSEVGAYKAEVASVQASLPEWVSLEMEFEELFKVDKVVTVEITSDLADGEPHLCMLAGTRPNELHRMGMTLTARVEKMFVLERTPLVVVAMPVYGASKRHLTEALKSVQAQSYPNWELHTFLDGKDDPEGLWGVLQGFASKDSRIVVMGRAEEQLGISRATNACLRNIHDIESVVAFLDCDDMLHPDALMHVAKVFSDRPGTRLVYTDEDKIDEYGSHSEPHFKPDFNMEMLLSQNYPCHLTAASSWMMKEEGDEFDPAFDGAQDHEFWLRYTKGYGNPAVVHIPKVLYHWRKTASSTASNHTAKEGAWDAGLKAVYEHVASCDLRGTSATVLKGLWPGTYRVSAPLKHYPSVSIVIPTKNNMQYLEPCIRSLQAVSYPSAVEVVIVNNGSDDSVVEEMRKMAAAPAPFKVKFVIDSRPFNWSALNNAAFGKIREDQHFSYSDVVIFINDDIEARDPYWLLEMVSELMLRDVAVVGPKLLYPNGTIQHAGVVIGMGGIAGHAHKRAHNEQSIYFSRPHLTQQVSAVTGACMAVRSDCFEEAGRFDEGLPKAFNDVDFCLKIRQMGKKIVYTPWATLTHHESVSRGSDVGSKVFNNAVRLMELRWGCSKYNDPFFNPNLDLQSERFVPAVPWTA